MNKRRIRRSKKIIRKRKPPVHTNPPLTRLSRVFLVIGVIFLLIWGTHKALYIRSLRISGDVLSTFSYTDSYKTHVSRIQVGRHIDASVVESGYVNGNWIVSPDNANHVYQSAIPGTPGNIIIYAHNTASLFGPLRGVKKGEIIHLTTTTGTQYTYVVTTVIEVNPSETSLLKPTVSETLTLYTCSGILDSKRFVIRAVPHIQTP